MQINIPRHTVKWTIVEEENDEFDFGAEEGGEEIFLKIEETLTYKNPQ